MLLRNPILQVAVVQLAGLLASPSQGHMAVHAGQDGHCPTFGAVLPAPKSPGKHEAVAAAKAGVKAFLDRLTADFNSSSLSVAVKSIHEPGNLFEYHYTPPNLDARGVQRVDGNSVYRIASVSKILPVMALLLLDGVRLEDPVTKYLPELNKLNEQPAEKDELTTVDWDDITLEALASHMAGISPEYDFDLVQFPSLNPETVGLPARSPEPLPGCSGFMGQRPCTAKDFYDHFGKAPPVYAPFNSPVYSNVAFGIIGFVVEKISGKSFADFTKEKILDPLGMNNTYATKPDDSLGAIPPGDTWWNGTLGFLLPTGNYYSSTTDLNVLLDGILTNKLLSPAKTRRWLKPLVSTSSTGAMVGAPWEIYRADNATADQRLIEVYTKSGGLTSYGSLVSLIPDYGLVMSILAAGREAMDPITVVGGTLVKAMLTGLEAAGKDEARPRFAGTYRDEATNSTLVLELNATDPTPGISAPVLISRGVDHLAVRLGIVLDGPAPDPATVPRARLRLYPAGLGNARREAWRGVIGGLTAEQEGAFNVLFPWPQTACQTWGLTGRPAWELQALDSFVFNLGADGAATSVELPAFKIKLNRV
ncbi:hypothetical protein GGTG_10940 [Gaeumannomyces tritici R3-111a-1]|uniref:Uncharacterized protein n=1 Tax=Gaeumannomyces tritici (strain R3-111a-1) TaxID=644352 RepID=J3PBR9_GAET3|nr:hypothetical protein GGTG_10940 [Gaeumannomyces tritici R3-111a-1]EJT71686.1 hypothetical protein GGTG_10940 [Gaeumannomyces tritici R3-111a-1]